MGFGLQLGMRAKALITGIMCGIAGVIVDVDHIPQYLYNIKVPALFVIPGFFDVGAYGNWSGRAIHPLVLYIGLIALVGITALLMQYSVRSTARSAAKSIVAAAQRVLAPGATTE